MAKRNRGNEWMVEHPDRRLLYSARERSKRLGIDFRISQDDVVIPEECPCCWVKLKPGIGRPPGKAAPSLDRIDNLRGYVPGNVWVICWRCNAIKHDAEPHELRAIADAVDARRLLCP